MSEGLKEKILTFLCAMQDEAAGLEHGLNAQEYALILQRLNRKPNLVELGVFSVMWSEHCSYKSSRRHLAKLPTQGARVIQGPGENAGVIDIDDGQAAIFKMESHNHPSFIEPYQGAATGVGGILRDVFTMGARPMALINALRFGAPEHPKTRALVSGVVAGIGGYGNCVGVPTIAGETNFHSGYNGNILVNAMAVGLADQDKIFYARGAKPDQPILYVGSKTGRDGIHGATMASAEFTEDSEEKRPTVQVGDPFTEKLLIEACLELMATDAIAAIQDMGAAGLTSSSVEIADKGGVGVEMNLDLVPQRETGMSAYEIMLSESQERMLMILNPGQEALAKSIFAKWDLDAVVIGKTNDTGRLTLSQFGEVVCDIPVRPLADDAPNYDRPHIAPKPCAMPDFATAKPQNIDHGQALLKIMASPNMASKRWVWEQYDRHVMGDTMDSSQSGGDAAIMRIHNGDKALAMTSDCTPRYVQADPFTGGMQAVAEAYRNLSAVGAAPVALTNNLNFGNPERPEIMGQFVYAIEGMAKACKVLNFPVISGNVSLYNETNGQAIPPTPVIGGVGLIKDLRKIATLKGAEAGDSLLMIGQNNGHLGASLYAELVWGMTGQDVGPPPEVDLALEKKNAECVRQLIAEGWVKACHDISDGGAACAAAEMALANQLGLVLEANKSSYINEVEWLFGEDQARYLMAVDISHLEDITQICKTNAVTLSVFGHFNGPAEGNNAEQNIAFGAHTSLPLKTLESAYEGWMPDYMQSSENA